MVDGIPDYEQLNDFFKNKSYNVFPNFDINNTLRVFKAEILGDINGTNYVKSFKWINH